MGDKKKMSYGDLKKQMLKFTGATGSTGGEAIQPEWIPYKWENEAVNSKQFTYTKYLTAKELQTKYGTSIAPGISYNPRSPEPPKDHRLVLFYGFNGMLAQKFSWMNGMSHEEIISRMEIAGDKVPYKIMFAEEFIPIHRQFVGTPNVLTEITFDDAMNIKLAVIYHDYFSWEYKRSKKNLLMLK